MSEERCYICNKLLEEKNDTGFCEGCEMRQRLRERAENIPKTQKKLNIR